MGHKGWGCAFGLRGIGIWHLCIACKRLSWAGDNRAEAIKVPVVAGDELISRIFAKTSTFSNVQYGSRVRLGECQQLSFGARRGHAYRCAGSTARTMAIISPR